MDQVTWNERREKVVRMMGVFSTKLKLTGHSSWHDQIIIIQFNSEIITEIAHSYLSCVLVGVDG